MHKNRLKKVIACMLVGLVSLSPIKVNAADTAVIEYNFNDSLECTDGSREAASTGTINYVEGIDGKAVDLENQSLNLGSIGFTETGDFTVILSVKMNTAAEHEKVLLANKNWNSRSNPGMCLASYNNGVGVEMTTTSNSTAVYRTGAGSGVGSEISDTKWKQIAVTFDRDGKMNMYVDGKITTSESISSRNGQSIGSNNWIIGADIKGNWGISSLYVDNIKFVNSAMSAAEVASEYQGYGLKLRNYLISEANEVLSSVSLTADNQSFLRAAIVEAQSESDMYIAVNKLYSAIETAQENREVPDFSFAVFSDYHIFEADGPEGIYDAMAESLNLSNRGIDAIVHLGDESGNGRGYPAEYDYIEDLVAYFDDVVPNMFVLGNHEVGCKCTSLSDTSDACEVQKGYFYDNTVPFYANVTGQDKLYYDEYINGYHFINLNSEHPKYFWEVYFSDEQLKWLDETLAQDTDTSKPVFINIHWPFVNTSDWNTRGYHMGEEADAQLREILKKYPQAVIFTGHMHNTWYGYDYYEGDFGTMVDSPSYRYNAGTGFIVNVYGDQIEVRLRDFNRDVWLDEYTINFTLPTHDVYDKTNELVDEVTYNVDKDTLLDDNGKTTVSVNQTTGYIELELDSLASLDGIKVQSVLTSDYDVFTGMPKHILVETSKDGTNWETALDSRMTLNTGLHYLNFPKEVTAQYVRVSFSEAEGSVAKIAELRLVGEMLEEEEPEPATGEIIVNYVDEKGNTLATSDKLTGTVGEEVSLTPKDIDGYVLKNAPSASYIITNETQTINLVYIQQTGSVTVTYKDVYGNDLLPQVIMTGAVGEKFTVTEESIDGYKIIQRPDSLIGTYTSEAQTIRFIYDQDNGSIVIKYVDTEGNSLTEDKTAVGKVGTELVLADAVLDIPGYALKQQPTTNPVFTSDPQTITFVYEMLKGSVTVQYQDTEGNKIAESETYTNKVGEAFSLSAKDIEGYVLKTRPDAETGVFTEEAQVFTYIYEAEQGTVTVNYKTEDGTKLADSVELTGKVGESYTAEVKDFIGYALKETPSNLTGTFTKAVQTVNVVYVVENGTVTVQYVDENGEELAEATTLTGQVGTKKTLEDKDITGYVLKTKPAEVTFTKEAQTIQYEYAKATGTVTIKYETTTGSQLAEPTIMTGNVGESFTIKAKTISGYVVKKKPDVETGTYTEEPQTYTYIYDIERGTITVVYLDEDGNELAPADTLTGQVGLPVTISAKEIEGYVVKEKPYKETLYIPGGVMKLTYVYVPAEATVVVKYLDTKGNEIAESVVMKGKVGETFTLSAKEIEGYEVKTKPDAETGTYTTNSQTASYIYDVVEGSVVVKYVDESNKEIAASKTLTGQVGTKYTITAPAIDGYAVKTKPTETGKYTKETQTLTYIYSIEEGQVIVKYVDESNKSLADQTTLTGQTGTTFTITPKEITGYVLKTSPTSETGTFTKAAQTFKYVYAVETGSITVNYEDTKGNKIADSITKTGQTGTKYTMTAKTITGYALKEKPEKETVTYTKVPQTYTYIYDIEMGSVIVKHVDTDGKEIADRDEITGQTGTSFTTTHKSIEGYELYKKPTKTSGKFTTASQTFEYVYDLKKGKVLVQYVDVDNNAITKSLTMTGALGTAFTLQTKEITGYELVQEPAVLAGTYTEDTQLFKYIYKKVYGNILINYVDEDGNALAEATSLSGQVGTEFKLTEKKIPGYAVSVKPKTLVGKYTKEIQIFEFVYAPKQSTIKVEYKDTEGNTLKEADVYTGQSSMEIQIVPDNFEDYTLVELPDSSDYVFTDEDQVITFTYKSNKVPAEEIKTGKVIVQYVDAEGKALQEDKILTGKVGDVFNVEYDPIAGYDLSNKPPKVVGTFTEEVQTYSFVYKKKVVESKTESVVPKVDQTMPTHEQKHNEGYATGLQDNTVQYAMVACMVLLLSLLVATRKVYK